MWLISSVRIRVLGGNSASRFQKSIEWFQSWQLRAMPAQYFYDFFRRNVSNQSILREWAASESAECRVKTAATCVVGSQDFFSRLVRATVQMDSDIKVVVLVEYRAHQIANLLGRGETHGICQRDHVQIFGFEQIESIDNFIWTPGITIGIPKGHGYVDNDSKAGIVGFLLNLFQFVERLLGRLVLILSKECFRDGIWKSHG